MKKGKKWLRVLLPIVKNEERGEGDVDSRLKFWVTLETCYSSFFLEMVLDTMLRMVDLFWVTALQLPWFNIEANVTQSARRLLEEFCSQCTSNKNNFKMFVKLSIWKLIKYLIMECLTGPTTMITRDFY
jgi:hypothetical protein